MCFQSKIVGTTKYIQNVVGKVGFRPTIHIGVTTDKWNILAYRKMNNNLSKRISFQREIIQIEI